MSDANKLGWRKKLLFASLTTIAFLLAAESMLALVGVRPIGEQSDPLIGFSRQLPLLDRHRDPSGVELMLTSPTKENWFNRQSFSKLKPPRTRRIFCVGGSTTYGRPFNDATSYCEWLRRVLPLVDPSVHWEVINAGGISYASYRVAAVMEELAAYEPDLFIVYSAHNEFLERHTYEDFFETPGLRRDLTGYLLKTRIGTAMRRLIHAPGQPPENTSSTLSAEVDEMLNHSVGPTQYRRDDPWRAEVLKHYEFNLHRMVSIARDANAELLFVTPASNLRDCWPFKSEFATEDRASEDQQSLRRANQLLSEEAYEQALTICSEILARDPRQAEAHFLTGRAQLALGQAEAAEAAFQRAVDEDVCPLRATSEIVATIEKVAEQRQVTLVPFQALLRERCQRELGHGCFGKEFFLDHVHPTLDVHRDLAIWILQAMQERSWVATKELAPAQIEQITASIERTIDRRKQGIAFRNLAKVLHWSGKFEEAGAQAQSALRLIPGDLESRFLLADCLTQTGALSQAQDQYEALLESGDYPRAHLPFGELLSRRGELDRAKAFLTLATVTDNVEHRARAHYELGRVHMQLGEYASAIETLQIARTLFPDDDTILSALATATAAATDKP